MGRQNVTEYELALAVILDSNKKVTLSTLNNKEVTLIIGSIKNDNTLYYQILVYDNYFAQPCSYDIPVIFNNNLNSSMTTLVKMFSDIILYENLDTASERKTPNLSEGQREFVDDQLSRAFYYLTNKKLTLIKSGNSSNGVQFDIVNVENVDRTTLKYFFE